MKTLFSTLKFAALGLIAVTAIAGCRPTYVHESYHETYVPAYPARHYTSPPVYVERRTVVVPRVVVAPAPVVRVAPPVALHARRDFDDRWTHDGHHGHAGNHAEANRRHDRPEDPARRGRRGMDER